MSSIFFSALALAGAASVACAGEVKPAPPASASASASAVSPPSVLDGYRGYEEPPTIAWRQANEEAAALRGHLGQLRGNPPVPAQKRDASREGARGERR